MNQCFNLVSTVALKEIPDGVGVNYVYSEVEPKNEEVEG